MKIQILKYFAIALFTFSIVGCEDFLEEVNPNEISTDSYWRNLNDCKSGLIAVYNQFRNGGISTLSSENCRADLVWPGWGRPNTSNEYYLQTFTDASQSANDKWSALYTGIFRANQVIKGLKGIESSMVTLEDKDEWSKTMAQARFFRGFFYFHLHNSFNNGSIIIIDFVPLVESDYYQELSTSEEVMAFYRADLEYAHANLPLEWTKYDQGEIADPQNAGRVTKGAAAAVLGKSYLYAEDYAKAIEYFEMITTDSRYMLAGVADNMTTRGELNQESILEVIYSMDFKTEETQWSAEGTTNTYNMLYSPKGGWRSNYPSCWLIMAYKGDKMDTNDPRNYVVDENGGDKLRTYSLRTSYSLALVDDEDLPYYGLTCAQATFFNNKETAYFRKYTNWDIYGKNGEKEAVPAERSGINFRVIRLADVYLMLAEAYIKGGSDETGVDKALMYINRVRFRSALQLLGKSGVSENPGATHDESDYTAQEVMDHLMYVERPLELAGEGIGIRQYDLRRWGITRERFQDLSTRLYYAEDYPFIKEDGKADTRWGAVLKEGTHPEGGYQLIDYQQAANNYVETEHAYYPIPNSERLANPNL